jgi:hypothetical protein
VISEEKASSCSLTPLAARQLPPGKLWHPSIYYFMAVFRTASQQFGFVVLPVERVTAGFPIPPKNGYRMI